MNSLEKALRAIHLLDTETYPVCLPNFQIGARLSDIPHDKYYINGECMAEKHIYMWNKFKHDVILNDNGTATLAEAAGCKVNYRIDQPPCVHKPLLKSIEEVKFLRKPDIYGSILARECLKTTRILCNRIGDRVLIMGCSDQGPFSLAGLLLGMDIFLMEIALGENEELIRKLLNYCTELMVEYAKLQLKAGSPVTSIGDSLSGSDVVSPSVYREYALPYEKIIAEEVHAAGGLLSLHICGNATPILEDMVSTGVDIIEIDNKTNLAEAKKMAKGKACILGNISTGILRTGTRKEIKVEVKKTLEHFKGSNGLIVAPGCAMASDTPFDNIDYLISTVQNFKVD